MSYLVGIDAGHGMHTEGKRTPKLIADIKVDGKVVKKKGEIIHENEWNRAVAKYLASALKRCGIDYFYTADMTGKQMCLYVQEPLEQIIRNVIFL